MSRAKVDEIDSLMEKLSTKEVPATPIKSARRHMHINAENFEQLMPPRQRGAHDDSMPSIGSPLSLKSCALSGIEPSELYPVPYETFQRIYCQTPYHNALGERLAVSLKKRDQKVLATKMFQDFEKLRQRKIETVKKLRNRLKAEESGRTTSKTSHDPKSISKGSFVKSTTSKGMPSGPRQSDSEFLKRKAAAAERRKQTLQRAREIQQSREISAIKNLIANDYKRDQCLRENSLQRQLKQHSLANKRTTLREAVEHNLREQLYEQKSVQRASDRSHTIYHEPMFGRRLRAADRKENRQQALRKISVHDAKLAYLTPRQRTEKSSHYD
mmetsp:Transcript_18111/g.28353  ORF Transcript_18111/g.28353 Transcript_18111/m.28353 type:complete len:328 (-) Transcript_18111:57-1040(-)